MKVRLVAIAAVSAAALATGPAGAAPAPVRVGVVLKDLDNPFFVAMFEGARAEASRLGAHLAVRLATSAADAGGQAARARTLVTGGYACYVVNPIDGKNLIAPLSGVRRPIVNVDSAIDPGAARRAGITIATYIGTDNLAAGRLAARAMRSLLPGGGEVVLVGGFERDISSNQRLAGFARGARGTRLRIVGRVAADYDRTTAQIAAARIMRDRPAIDGFFAANDVMALGIADAVRVSGGTGAVKIIGVDGIPAALDAVRAGSLSATVAQYPYAMGRLAVDACVVAARGAHLPARVDAPIALVTRANVAAAAAAFPRPPRGYPDPLARLLRPRRA
jgi:ribose transport system substrate-binding protein